jgi:transcriptional regulator with XRE-family HTH domain
VAVDQQLETFTACAVVSASSSDTVQTGYTQRFSSTRNPANVGRTRSGATPRQEGIRLVSVDNTADADDAADASVEVDPGMVRAGAAAAARRRELDISQRSLAADGIINAGALISFEKGRSWPRERTRAKLEEVLQWPPGTIARIRRGDSVAPGQPVEPPAGGDQGSLIAQAVEAAVNTLGATVGSLPPIDDPAFTPRVTAILADLRQLEAVAARAARIGRLTPPLLKALSTVRRQMDELTLLGATATTATLGQRLYATRRWANLTISETAQAAGVPEDAIVAAEAGQPVPAAATELIESLVGQIDWR